MTNVSGALTFKSLSTASASVMLNVCFPLVMWFLFFFSQPNVEKRKKMLKNGKKGILSTLSTHQHSKFSLLFFLKCDDER